MFFVSLIYLLIFSPASFLCWYRPAYKAFKDDSSANFMLFFFVFFFQIIILIWQTIGILEGGTFGIIKVIALFDGSVAGTLIGLLGVIIVIGFGVCSVGCALMLMKIHALYRSSGASVDKGVQEFQREFFSNASVQQAASQMAASAVQTEINRNRY